MGISCAGVPINPISGSPEPIITSPSPETASVTPGLASPNLSNINLNMSRAVVCDFTGIETTDAARLPASVVLRGQQLILSSCILLPLPFTMLQDESSEGGSLTLARTPYCGVKALPEEPMS